jgi:PIN domain nuclease of toxin-antitoxin system
VRLLIDTVTFIWATSSPERISRRAMSALQDASAVREISSISISEIAIKQALKKLVLQAEDVLAGIRDLQLSVLPYTSEHALELFSLPLHHADPFDRQIIAQGLSEEIPIVTCDEKFKLYKGLQVLW